MLGSLIQTKILEESSHTISDISLFVVPKFPISIGLV